MWLKIPLFIIVAVFAVGGIVMLLWNALVPALFGGPTVTYWQAIGLFVLSKILFHGFGGKHRGHRGHWRHDKYWKQRFAERMASMTPEERQKCRDLWKRRGGAFWEEDYTQEKEKKGE